MQVKRDEIKNTYRIRNVTLCTLVALI